MAVMRTPQEHVETEGSTIDDTLTPTDHDANAVDLGDTLNYLASQIADITGESTWEAPPDITIAAINAKTFLDEKLALRRIWYLQDITVPSSQNWKILSVAGSEIPAGKNIKAIGGTTKGLVTAQATSFGAHNLDEVLGSTAINPKNLLLLVDGDTGDPILSSSRLVYALLQHEATATDGAAFTDTTPERAQMSFVRPNSTYDDLEACPVADIENKKVNLAWVERQDLDSWVEQDFLVEQAFVDLPAAAQQVTLDNAIDNQSTTPATQATHTYWRIDDDVTLNFQTSDGARDLLELAPAAAGDQVTINADALDVNVGAAGTVDFDNGVTVDSGGTSINLGVTAGRIDASAIKLAATSGLAEVEGTGVTLDGMVGAGGAITIDGTQLDADFGGDADGHLIQAPTSASDRALLVASRNAGAGKGDLKLEADDDVIFETAQETSGIPLDDVTTGPISGLFGQSFTSIAEAIKYAGSTAGVSFEEVKTFIISGGPIGSGTNIPAATLDLTTYNLPWPAGGSTSSAARVLVYLNGRLLRGAAATGTGDIYPGDTPANGDIKHDFPAPFKNGWVLFSVGYQ
jgi:hypothetical protein